MLEVDINAATPLPTEPVLIPKTVTHQTRAASEAPDPTQSCTHDTGADYSHAALPIIVMLPAAPSDPTATLTRPGGAMVSSAGDDLCLIYEGHFFTTDTVYGPAGAQGLSALHALLIIARTPLVKGTYTVSVNYGADAPLTRTFASRPAVQYPHLLEIGQQCSPTNAHFGKVGVVLVDTPDGMPTATYHVALGKTTKAVSLAEGKYRQLTFTGLEVGSATVHVTGPVSLDQVVTVLACPSWQAARVKFGRASVAKHRVSITLDNRYNKSALRFTVHDTRQKTVSYRVSGKKKRTVHAVVFRYTRTVISVKIGSHTIAKAGYRTG